MDARPSGKRATRLGHGSALLALGLLVAGTYAAVLGDLGAALRLDRSSALSSSAGHPGSGEPAPGTARQAWHRSGLGTVVNPLLAVGYPGVPAWIGLASAGVDQGDDTRPPRRLSRDWHRAGLGTVLEPPMALAHAGSMAWHVLSYRRDGVTEPWPMSYAMLAAIAPSSGRAGGDARRGVEASSSMGGWMYNGNFDSVGLLNEGLAEIARLGAGDHAWGEDEPVFELGPNGEFHARVSSAQALASYFDMAEYDLDLVRDGLEFVPRRYLISLPPDLKAVESTDERKQLFIKAMLPVILRVNEELEADRARLLSLQRRVTRGDALRLVDKVWLDGQYQRYELAEGDIAELVRRVDIIPPSLAIAQAAEESGWGTSRFAREGNALFGQYTDPDGPGLDPRSEEAIGKYRIRSYDSLYETVRSYALNLNYHKAYKKFRAIRAELRAKDAPIDGNKLAGALTRYSERGKAYVKTIRLIMRANALRHFDGVRLNDQLITLVETENPDRSS